MIATESDKDPSKKLVPASTIIRPDPDKEERVPYTIHGKMYYLTDREMQAYLDKEEKMKKAGEEAKLLDLYKPKVVKVVREEGKKLSINPKEVIFTKAGEQFKKAHDAEHEVLKREHSKKVGVDSLISYLVMASMVKTKENARFSLKLRKFIADHPDQEKLKSKKVKLEALGYHVD
uniref:Uncharacterized protein n=1 Tax=Tanacetum cinerariifolium TaxID=118510 RepID=A0A6L2JVC9_TANCI|nr:hypothetical protein [Tanacetum cinerariifolium]